jgi:hypothetical protein
MVEFRKDGYSIHIHTVYNPVEDWLDLQHELLTLIAISPEDVGHNPWRATRFLSELLPEWEDAKKMVQ